MSDGGSIKRDWSALVGGGPTSQPNRTFADLLDEFCAAITAEFGLECNVDQISEESSDMDNFIGELYDHIKEYSTEWAMFLIQHHTPHLALGSDPEVRKDLIMKMAKELLSMKDGFISRPSAFDPDAPERRPNMNIADGETVEHIASRIEVCFQGIQEAMLIPKPKDHPSRK